MNAITRYSGHQQEIMAEERSVRVVPVQDIDGRAPVQELQALEDAAEGPVSGGAKRDGKGEEPLQDEPDRYWTSCAP